MPGSSQQHPRGSLWLCATIALLFLMTSCSSAPVTPLPDTKVAAFSSSTEEWVQTPFAQVGPGSEFTYESRLYKVDDSGKAEIVPDIDAGKLEQADRHYDDSSFRGPRHSDAVQVLDDDLRVTGHVLLSKAEPPTRLCFHGRVYYMEASRNLVYRGVVTSTKAPRPAGEGYALEKTLIRSQPIKITQRGLQHVMDRHTPGGTSNAGKSVFSVDWQPLVTEGVYYIPIEQPNGLMLRVIDAGRTIGTDTETGRQTSRYRIVTKPSGELVTTYPVTR